MPTPSENRVKLSPEMERRRIIPVPQAAELKNISPDTFRRHFKHLIRQITPRRQGVMLGDLIGD
jgi:hypothetical protein